MCDGFMLGAMFGCHEEGALGKLKKMVHDDKEDPRTGVDMMKHMMGELDMLKSMQSAGDFDPPGGAIPDSELPI